MLAKAYAAQCVANEGRAPILEGHRYGLALFSLALGTFCIGTSEFASMGIIQLLDVSLGIDIPSATHAITAYAIGCVIGAPLLTLLAAHLNRRTLLLSLMGLFVTGNLLSSAAPNITTLCGARFVSGMPQGAYFGAAAVVASRFVGQGQGGKAFALVMTGLTVATILGAPLATFLGQNLGWRNTYVAAAGAGGIALLALWAWTPGSDVLRGGSLAQEVSGLRRGSVWAMMIVAAIGVASIFSVYTFIGPLVTDVAHMKPKMIPIALALFGASMTVGTLIGGRLADLYAYRGLVIGFGCALAVLAILAFYGAHEWVLFATLFGVGTTMMIAIPTIQVTLTRFAPESPTLMGAMNLASLNIANAIGAWVGGLTIAAGYGLLSPPWAGFGLTLAGLLIFAVTVPSRAQLVPA